ncbi:hypothetical protein D623_10027642 [Myotis brandtii]|uniref:Uncharacterized protein n=1 Tax=Myotis brandtii TaxID=109478 RepID=S7MXB8_MYOBR|nr:hypothetical protein D623_10027642 [Myotis brandtii]
MAVVSALVRRPLEQRYEVGSETTQGTVLLVKFRL